MFEILKSFKHKHLLTLNMFVNKTKILTLIIVKDYNKVLSGKIKREDFIPYNMKDEFIENHKPLFKNWAVCNQTSDEKTKVAKMISSNMKYRNQCQKHIHVIM